MKKIDWAKTINSMTVPFPETGKAAPEKETILKSEEMADIVGTCTRLTLDIFIFDNDDLEQAFMMQNDKIRIYQDITLGDTVALANKSKKKKT